MLANVSGQVECCLATLRPNLLPKIRKFSSDNPNRQWNWYLIFFRSEVSRSTSETFQWNIFFQKDPSSSKFSSEHEKYSFDNDALSFSSKSEIFLLKPDKFYKTTFSFEKKSSRHVEFGADKSAENFTPKVRKFFRSMAKKLSSFILFFKKFTFHWTRAMQFWQPRRRLHVKGKSPERFPLKNWQ